MFSYWIYVSLLFICTFYLIVAMEKFARRQHLSGLLKGLLKKQHFFWCFQHYVFFFLFFKTEFMFFSCI